MLRFSSSSSSSSIPLSRLLAFMMLAKVYTWTQYFICRELLWSLHKTLPRARSSLAIINYERQKQSKAAMRKEQVSARVFVSFIRHITNYIVQLRIAANVFILCFANWNLFCITKREESDGWGWMGTESGGTELSSDWLRRPRFRTSSFRQQLRRIYSSDNPRNFYLRLR